MVEVDKEKMCEVGDILYRIKNNTIFPIKIIESKQMELGHYVYKDNFKNSFFSRAFGKVVFKTIEEAQLALKRKELIAEKRKKLLQYELALNAELGIESHMIIK